MDDEFARWDTETENEVKRPGRQQIRPSVLRRRQPVVGRTRTPVRTIPPQAGGRLRHTRPALSSRPVRPIAWPVYPAVVYPPSAPLFREPLPDVAPGPATGTEYVRWVQSCLNQAEGLGLLISGIMDAPTRSVVRGFQRKHDLPVDGIVGPPTEAALAAACGRSGGPVTNNGAATTPTSSITGPPSTEAEPEWEAEWASEREASRSSPDYIRWVQAALNQILGMRLAVDGIVGPQTRSAIRTFQRRRTLEVDGILDPPTEASLLAAGAPPRFTAFRGVSLM
jgi:peptidoglycan hydrolase-like protein with peptidoglycan-binding domain